MDISTYFPIWNKLNANEQQALSANVRELHYHKGDLIQTGGDCMGLVLVASGQLRAYTISEDGREITMYRLFERDICLFSASCMMHSIQLTLLYPLKRIPMSYSFPRIFTVALWKTVHHLPITRTKLWQVDFRM